MSSAFSKSSRYASSAFLRSTICALSSDVGRRQLFGALLHTPFEGVERTLEAVLRVALGLAQGADQHGDRREETGTETVHRH